MKKIKIYTVTYNDEKALNENLKTFFESDLSGIEYEYNIINNHTNINVRDEYKDKVKILNNSLRPDFSRGHLSRNWNQALINGFRDLNNPDCDIVICCQDDNSWTKNWVEKLLKIHETYDFYTCDYGDGFHSYRPEAVKKIGLWDERFCSITFQEADYFLRALIFHKEKSSINDHHHKRTLNCSEIVSNRQNTGKYRQHNGRHEFYTYTNKLFNKKWPGVPANDWKSDYANNRPTIEYFVLYPYFENHITNKENFITV